MSDYLRNLVERTLSPNVAVRPRLPAFFEPPVPSAFDRSFRPFGLENEGELQTAPPASAKNTKLESPKKIDHTKPEADQPETRRQGFANAPEPPPTSLREHKPVFKTDSVITPPQPVKPNSEPNTVPTDAPLRIVAPVPVAIRAATAPELAAEDKHRAPPSLNEKTEPVIQRPLRPNSASQEPEKNDAAPKTLHKPSVNPPIPKTQNFEFPANRILFPPVRPVRENVNLPIASFARTRLHPQVSSSPASLPTIQVTIGRVEVRASTPMTAAPRNKVKKDPMSLEVYLQRRAEGG